MKKNHLIIIVVFIMAIAASGTIQWMATKEGLSMFWKVYTYAYLAFNFYIILGPIQRSIQNEKLYEPVTFLKRKLK